MIDTLSHQTMEIRSKYLLGMNLLIIEVYFIKNLYFFFFFTYLLHGAESCLSSIMHPRRCRPTAGNIVGVLYHKL